MADWPTSPPTAPPAHPGLHAGGADYPSRPPEQWPTHAPAPLWGGPPVPPPGPTPPADPGPGSGRTWGVVVVAIAVVVLIGLVIVGGSALLTDSGSAEEATDTTVDLSDPEITAPPSEEPITPTMPTIPGLEPPGGADPSERAQPLDDILPELIAFVEETRGQEFETDPVVEAVSAEEFEGLLRSAQAEELEGLQDAVVTDTALGLLEPGFDLESATGDLAATSVLGFYDPETTELYVKGEQITPFVQYVIVHELTHALDDQVVGLDGLEELATRPDESAFGFLSLVEGTANFVASAFHDQMSEEDLAAYDAEQYSLGLEQLPSAMGLPAILLVEGQVPYASGERFVSALVEEGGTAEIDTAYGEPPTTSEQILDPAVFLAGEGAVALTPPTAPAGVDVAEEGAFGAVDLRLLELVTDPFSALLDPDIGMIDPVEGYGGGRYVSWTEGGRSCISLEAVGDDEAGSTTIQTALEEWAGSVDGAEVGTRPGGGGVPVVTATRCG